jgi:hypothetical protein
VFFLLESSFCVYIFDVGKTLEIHCLIILLTGEQGKTNTLPIVMHHSYLNANIYM